MAKGKKSVLPGTETKRTVEWLWANDTFQDRYPALYEFLASGMYEGEQRKGGSITLFCGNGRLKVCFHDKQTQNAFYAQLEPMDDIVNELEVILAGEHDPWQSTQRNGAKPVF